MNCKLIFYILAIALLFTACQDDLEKQDKIEEGVPVVAQFSYKVKESEQVQSRTAQNPEIENSVVQLFALAFDSDGALSGSGPVAVDGTGYFTLSMSSGSNKTLYLVANYDKGTGGLVDEEGNAVDLSTIQSLAEFKKVGFEHNETNRNQTDRSLFLMVGSMSGFSVNINGGVTGAQPVPLDRISARLNFNITTGTSETLTDIKFEPYYYYVDNIPVGSYLVPQETDWKAGQEENYSSMSGTDHRHLDNVDPDGKNSSFTFYLMENRLQPTSPITSTSQKPEGTTLYSLREKRDEGAPVQNGDGQQYEQGPFTYAPEYGTYVVIYGRVQGKQGAQGDNPGSDVIADARFIIHLGETGSEPDNETLVNNYNTRRNVEYTYNVTITGIHSMHVEVKEEKEVRPGVEGDLILTQTGAYFDLDAHFNTAVFKVDLSQWSDTKTPPVSWAYSTPFGRSMKTLDRTAFITENGVTKINNESALQTDLTNNDYKWIQFAINRENLEINENPATSVVPYPGEEAYTGSKNNGPAPALGESNVVGKKLYDVNQLMNRLYLIYKNKEPYIETDGTVVVTAYIDEFLYTYDPTTAYYKAPGRTTDIDPTLWKRSINENPRWLYLSTDSKFSPDGATSMANAIVVFSQSPIYTIYNANKVSTAWGTESIVEDTGFDVEGYNLDGQLSPDVIPSGEITSYPNNRLNGYENSVYWLTKKNQSQRWDTYIDYTQGLGDEERYKLVTAMKGGSLQAAPLVRNRDFDGDGIIDANEIRWYLGAFGQLQGMILGKYSLPRAQLYDVAKYVTTNKVTPVHIASSTYIQNGDYYPIKVWGEQEGANGASNQQGAEGGIGNSTGNYYYYRCMRNLGIQYSTDGTETSDPQEYIGISHLWGNAGAYSQEVVFDLSRMDINSLRSPFLNTLLPAGLKERDQYGNSRPSRKFAVLQRDADGYRAEYTWRDENYFPTVGNTLFLNDLSNIINGGEGRGSYQCPKGYRMPNHSELLIMQIYSKDSRIINGHADRDVLFLSYEREEDYDGYLYIAKNLFSYAGTDPYWSGRQYVSFVVKNGNVSLASAGIGSGFGLKVRCVRDIE